MNAIYDDRRAIRFLKARPHHNKAAIEIVKNVLPSLVASMRHDTEEECRLIVENAWMLAAEAIMYQDKVIQVWE